MKVMRAVLRVFWWVLAAAVPYVQHIFYVRHAQAIGCFPYRDCYLPGAQWLDERLLALEFSALVLWPACLWFLIAKPLIYWGRRFRAGGNGHAV